MSPIGRRRGPPLKTVTVMETALTALATQTQTAPTALPMTIIPLTRRNAAIIVVKMDTGLVSAVI